MSLVDSDANALLDLVLGTPGLLPATVYVGALLQVPNSDGTGVVEPSGGAYARVSVANNSTQWPNATGRSKIHANDIIFPTASGANWGNVIWYGIFDASVGGSLRLAGPLDVARNVLDGDVLRFLASNPLTITHPFLTV